MYIPCHLIFLCHADFICMLGIAFYPPHPCKYMCQATTQCVRSMLYPHAAVYDNQRLIRVLSWSSQREIWTNVNEIYYFIGLYPSAVSEWYNWIIQSAVEARAASILGYSEVNSWRWRWIQFSIRHLVMIGMQKDIKFTCRILHMGCLSKIAKTGSLQMT